MKRKRDALKLNNAGSAIVTVLVLIAFIGILATVILYAAGMNYIMKTNDLRIKRSFYQAETALEAIRADLVVEVSAASGKAYTDTMIRYAGVDEVVRMSLYHDEFFETLAANWQSRLDADPELLQTIVNERYAVMGIADPPKITFPAGGGGRIEYIDESGAKVTDVAQAHHAVIEGVHLVYTDEDGFTTMITTDLYLKLPDLDWAVRARSDEDNAPKNVEMADYVFYRNWVKE